MSALVLWWVGEKDVLEIWLRVLKGRKPRRETLSQEWRDWIGEVSWKSYVTLMTLGTVNANPELREVSHQLLL